MTQVRVQHGFELTVSAAHASDADSAILERLRARRKLCLVLDLDHTLVHATGDERAAEYAAAAAGRAAVPEARLAPLVSEATSASESTIAALSSQAQLPGSDSSPSAPHEMPAQDVSRVDAAAAASLVGEVFSWRDGPYAYSIKKRPFLREFLEAASDLFELQVDTAGTRAYANMILANIDPDRRFFGERVVSRCDSRLRHKQVAWLHRAVSDDSMVVIIDDTTDVWRGARNLIAIEPYMFWRCVSEAELNNRAGRSMVDTGAVPPPLPAQPTLASSEHAHAPPEVPLELSPKGGRTPPAAAPTTPSAASVFEEEPHSYLQDILRLLRRIHAEYYRQYDAHVGGGGGGGRPVRIAGSSSSSGGSDNLEAASPPMPSVPDIIAKELRTILADTCLVFSGVFPLGAACERSNLWRRAVAFGAAIADAPDATRCAANAFAPETLESELATAMRDSRGAGADAHAATAAYSELQRFNRGIVTHVIARAPGTAKVRAGASDPAVRVVHLSWLEQCLLQYRRLPEADFSAELGQTLAECAAREQTARVSDLRELRRLSLAEAVARKRQEAAVRALQQSEDEDDDGADDDDVDAATAPGGKIGALPSEEGSESDATGGGFGADLEAAFAEHEHGHDHEFEHGDDDDHDEEH